MSQIDPNLTIPEEAPADPTTQKKLRRSLLLIALAGLMAPCILCWYSSRVETIEQILIPGLAGVIILIYTAYILYQREQKQDLAPPLWRVILIFLAMAAVSALALIWLSSSIGWHEISGPVILVMSAWSFFLAGRRVWESWSFDQQAVEEENSQAEIKMISKDGGHPIHPQLAYRYAEKYRGQLENNKISNNTPEIIEAIAGGKFRVKVKYLPDNPRVHRYLGWWIVE